MAARLFVLLSFCMAVAACTDPPPPAGTETDRKAGPDTVACPDGGSGYFCITKEG